MSELNYTFDEMWNELFGDEYSQWLLSMPKWWQFRKRREWRKARPSNRRVGEGEKDERP